MARPTYYLWRSANQTPDDYERQKALYTQAGYRVVTFQDGRTDLDLLTLLHSLLRKRGDV